MQLSVLETRTLTYWRLSLTWNKGSESGSRRRRVSTSHAIQLLNEYIFSTQATLRIVSFNLRQDIIEG